MHTFTTTRRIEFVDTDMGGICHFSRYPIFMETAEHLFRQAAGHSVHMERDGRPIGWPRVSVSVEYHAPARFEDILDIEVRVVRLGAKSMTCGFRIRCQGLPVVSGTMTSVCCVLDPAGEVRGIPIPDDIRARFSVAPEEDDA